MSKNTPERFDASFSLRAAQDAARDEVVRDLLADPVAKWKVTIARNRAKEQWIKDNPEMAALLTQEELDRR